MPPGLMRVIKASSTSNIVVIRHEVTGGVKNQAAADVSKIKVYSLIDVKKQGALVELMRKAMRERNFDNVDNQIREMVLPYLYNEGRGKMIPISRLIRNRNKERGPSKRLPPERSSKEPGDADSGDFSPDATIIQRTLQYITGMVGQKSKANVGDEPCREVCWKLSERGSVGETALHIALLVATVVHLDLARRLVRLFPKLVNDVYQSDEFYGESALHIAIVNEDPRMVKYMLDYGADVQERAIGNFFCADDQKDSRVDSLEHEYYNLSFETDYAGHVYWGEYPLSFAICLELEDCYRLLLAKKSDPDRQDSNGNTVLHMAVIVNKMNMFDLAYELGADMTIKNKQGLTPLALAAKLTRTEMFFHILKLQRDVYWQFCEIAYAAYDLEEIDSIDVNSGEVNKTAALTVVAFGEELGHLDMIEGMGVDLLQSKWEKFAKRRFFRQIKMFFAYFVITFFAFTLRPAPHIPPSSDQSTNYVHFCFPEDLNKTTTTPNSICWGEECDDNTTAIKKQGKGSVNATMNVTIPEKLDYCYLLNFETSLDKTRRIFDLMMVIGAGLYILAAIREAQRLGLETFLQTWSTVPGRVMFMASCILIVASIPFRLVCAPRTEDRIIVAAMFLTPMHFLYFCRGFKSVGPFVVMIYKMIIGDLLCFVIIYMVFVFGFAEAFFVIFRSHRGNGTNLYFSGVIDSVMTMFLMSLGEFSDAYAEFENTDHPFLAKFLFLIYMILVSVLLVNMLIAMMGHTYEDIASRPNEWLRQWARIVQIVERGLSREERSEYQTRYSVMRNGRRVFICKWETTEEEREEIERLKELTAANKTSREKRRTEALKKKS